MPEFGMKPAWGEGVDRRARGTWEDLVRLLVTPGRLLGYQRSKRGNKGVYPQSDDSLRWGCR